jgi:hypothetical protein
MRRGRRGGRVGGSRKGRGEEKKRRNRIRKKIEGRERGEECLRIMLIQTGSNVRHFTLSVQIVILYTVIISEIRI